MAVTIKDVAKAAGVSHTTVSRALNDSPLIRDKTKEAIKTLAREMGYMPNLSARSLKLDKAFNYGLFFSTLESATTNNFIAKTIQGVKALMPKEYRMTIEGIKELNDYETLHRQNYDGILVVSQRYDDDEFLRLLKEKDIPAVLLNRQITGLNMPTVAFDDEVGMKAGVRHLYDKGCRNIGFIKGKEGFFNSDRRYQGYMAGLEMLDIRPKEALVREGDFTIASGYHQAKDLLTVHAIDAIFCSNDEMAIGAMKAIEDSGLTVGIDIAVAGFDDIEAAAYCNPSLTTVRRNIDAMASEGVRLLNSLVDGSLEGVPQVTMTTELVIRESSKAQ